MPLFRRVPARGAAVFWRSAALAAVLGAAACGGDAASVREQTAAAAADEPREVQVVPVTTDRLVRTIDVTGTLAAEEQVTLSLKVAGRLHELHVDLGSRVQAGQVLARLVPTDFELRESQALAALHQARARLGLPLESEDDHVDIESTALVRSAAAVLEEARLNRDRIRTFVERGIAAKAQLDAAEAALQVAESRHQDALEEVRNRLAVLEQRRTELELARQAVRDSVLVSPLDGIVRERHVSVGEFLAAGSPVVTIVRMHPLRLRLSVPERDAPLVRVNQQVLVRVEGDQTRYQGRVARVSPAIDENSRTLLIEAEVPNRNGALRPGSFANATIITESSDDALLVPRSAIVTFAGVDKVLLVREGRVVEQRVTVGRRADDRVEILDGVQAGDPVIVRPGNLTAGARVRVTGQAAGADLERATAR